MIAHRHHLDLARIHVNSFAVCRWGLGSHRLLFQRLILSLWNREMWACLPTKAAHLCWASIYELLDQRHDARWIHGPKQIQHILPDGRLVCLTLLNHSNLIEVHESYPQFQTALSHMQLGGKYC
jgi:hypothetical protein